MNKNKTLNFVMKSLDITDGEQGIFTGYANVYNIVDSDKDIIRQGCFADSIKEHNGEFVLLYQHDRDKPIGKVKLEEDSTGLRIAHGELNLDIELARDVYSNLKKGILSSFSIGFGIAECADTKDERGDWTREITKGNLREVSIVTFPANQDAKIENIKSMSRDSIKTIRDFENCLGELGYSKKEACLIASKGYKSLGELADSKQEKLDDNIELLKKLQIALGGA